MPTEGLLAMLVSLDWEFTLNDMSAYFIASSPIRGHNEHEKGHFLENPFVSFWWLTALGAKHLTTQFASRQPRPEKAVDCLNLGWFSPSLSPEDWPLWGVLKACPGLSKGQDETKLVAW